MLQWSMAAVCSAAAVGVGVRRAAAHQPARHSGAAGYLCRDGDRTDVAMLVVMAAMFACPPLPVPLWRAVFVGIGVAAATELISSRWKPGGLTTARVGAGCYHLLAVAAMLYTTVGHSGHAAHMPEHSGPPILSWLFAAVFAVDATASTAVAVVAPKWVHASRTHLAAAAAPHLVMDAAMVLMLCAVGH